ncbi:MAG: cyclophilin-like fold protein, partial [Lachnospiraceae bacterium]
MRKRLLKKNDGQTASDTEHVSTEKAPESTVAAPETASQQETVSPETAKQTDPETSDETAASPSESKPEETQSETSVETTASPTESKTDDTQSETSVETTASPTESKTDDTQSETSVETTASPIESKPEETQSETSKDTEEKPAMKTLIMKIDGKKVTVDWEENESVAALTELVKDKPLTVQTSMYGGFEQVGSIGTSLPRNDAQTTTQAGDIVLYSGNQIVVFY